MNGPRNGFYADRLKVKLTTFQQVADLYRSVAASLTVSA